MVTLIHMKHKTIGNNASSLIQKLGCLPTCTTHEDDADEVVDCNKL